MTYFIYLLCTAVVHTLLGEILVLVPLNKTGVCKLGVNHCILALNSLLLKSKSDLVTSDLHSGWDREVN